jgi:signal transduction histidine kinase
MDMRQEEKIFALFKRLHSHVEGSGIGLYIVKKMIEHAEGKIAVESQVGVGSTFSVYFKR